MATSQLKGVIQHLRSILRDDAVLTDVQLLEDYISRHDEAAFAALVRRHGPMVWGVCRRVLHNHHAAEDAFQATFLVLVRRAASIASRELFANWLYGVAHQSALKARATAAKRKERERQVTEMPEPTVTQQDQWSDLQPLLDEELSRLPDIYRAVIVLCDLEGKTRKDVAEQLGCPEGTVAGRLARARAMLAKRLTTRGVAFSGGALAAVLADQAASAGVPNSVVVSTIKAATLFAAGKAAATGAISVKVAALTEGVMKAMLFTKLKAAIAVVLILGFVATGAILTGRRASAEGEQPAAAEERVNAPAKQEKEAFTAWGKEVGGLQAGLGFRPGEKRAYSHGETVTLVVRVRNVGKQNVKFQGYNYYFTEIPPTITDGGGKPFVIEKVKVKAENQFGVPVQDQFNVELAAGNEIQLAELKFNLKPASENGVNERNLPGVLKGTGKFQIHYGQVDYEGDLGKLATGKLELEVKEADDKKPTIENPDKKPTVEKPVEPATKKEKEKVTAWGKEVNGVQVGIQFGEHRVYKVGEAVTLIVRLRNNGKNEVPFSDDAEYFEKNPPLITDANNKAVTIKERSIFGFKRAKSVAPGKEVDLCKLRLDLRPDTDRKKDVEWTLYGTGKFHIKYEDIPVVGEVQLGSPGMTLATGKLELEVRESR